nr:tetratricopeptide repeat protein [Deltaproteobacteria bacterium]
DPARCETVHADDRGFDSTEQQRIDDAQRKVARAEGLARAGNLDDAQRLVTESLADLTDVQAPRARAAALLAKGHHHYRAGDLDSGGEAMKEALLWASRSADAATIADVWLHRAQYVLLDEKDAGTAGTLLEAVEVAVAAVPDQPALLSRLESLRGLIALDAGQTAQARDRFSAALDHAQRAAPTLSRQTALMSQLAAAELSLSHGEKSRDYTRQNLRMLVDAYGEHHPQVATMHGNLGFTCWQMGDDACADEHFRIALDRTPANTPARAKATLMLGQFEYDHGQRQSAGQRAREAIAIFLTHFGEDYAGLTSPRLLLSNVLRREGDFDGALEQAQLMVRLADRTTPVGHPKRAVARSGLGTVLRERGEPEPALAAHLQALEIRTQALDAGDRRIGYSQVGVAACLLDLERFERAEAMAMSAIAVFEEVSGATAWRAEARFLLARAIEHRDRSRAQSLARTALRLYETLGDGGTREADEIRRWFDERGVIVTPE